MMPNLYAIDVHEPSDMHRHLCTFATSRNMARSVLRTVTNVWYPGYSGASVGRMAGNVVSKQVRIAQASNPRRAERDES